MNPCVRQCRAYLFICDMFMLLMGMVLQLVGISVAMRDPVFEIGDVTGSRLVKLSIFALGSMTMITSCIGFRFWTKIRRKRIGIIYVAVLIFCLALQLALMFLIYYQWTLITEHTLDNTYVPEIQRTPEQVQADKENPIPLESMDLMSKSFSSFTTRFQDKYKCEIIERKPSMPPKPQFMLAAEMGLPGDAVDMSPAPVNETEIERRLSYGGQCDAVVIECSEEREYAADFVNEHCIPKPGNEEVFYSQCNGCILGYYEQYIKGSYYLQTHPGLEKLWTQANKLVFCRCYGRMIDSLSRHGMEILISMGVYISVWLSLIFGVIYLMICAPPGGSADADEIELF